MREGRKGGREGWDRVRGRKAEGAYLVSDRACWLLCKVLRFTFHMHSPSG